MKKRKYIKIPLPKWTWWQFSFVGAVFILALKPSTSISGLIQLIETLTKLIK
ncbi:hypothetical protein VP395_10900 [Mariniflexile soesokkakense]|uniref:Uncharacterized protein n=1 Tax=Mariniflexile soesokkakense TaxID=1343160 RepID=A0ABV0AAV2_9FLAO